MKFVAPVLTVQAAVADQLSFATLAVGPLELGTGGLTIADLMNFTLSGGKVKVTEPCVEVSSQSEVKLSVLGYESPSFGRETHLFKQTFPTFERNLDQLSSISDLIKTLAISASPGGIKLSMSAVTSQTTFESPETLVCSATLDTHTLKNIEVPGFPAKIAGLEFERLDVEGVTAATSSIESWTIDRATLRMAGELPKDLQVSVLRDASLTIKNLQIQINGFDAKALPSPSLGPASVSGSLNVTVKLTIPEIHFSGINLSATCPTAVHVEVPIMLENLKLEGLKLTTTKAEKVTVTA